MVYLQGIAVVFIEVILYRIYMETFCDYKEQFQRKGKIFFIVILAFLSYGEAVLWGGSFWLKEMTCLITMSVISDTWFKTKYKKIFILTVIYLGMLLVTDYLMLGIYKKIFLKEVNESILGQYLIIGLGKAVFFLVIIFLRKKMDKKKISVLNDVEWIQFLFFPVFSICVIIASISDADSIMETKNEQLFWIIAFGLIGMNILIFCLLENVTGRELRLRENKLAEMKAGQQFLLYQSISKNYQKQNEKLHEYKNQIACMLSLAKNGNYRELEQYLSQISGELFYELDSINTNHPVVNAVMNIKYQEAVQHGIVVVLKVNDLSQLWLEEKDIVIIMANLLDNAIEALKDYKGKKIIKIKAVLEDNNFVFSVCNTYAGKLKYQQGKLVTTKKEDEMHHGIGIQNVIKAVEKYQGFHVVSPQEKEFIFSIMIPFVLDKN